jgi:UDP:flavonoid glycosyltransferase YjiC (YdhE family)
MKIVLASYGSRGDVEPGAAVGRELLRRGHDVCMAVPPDLVDFVESAGLPAVAYGLDTREWLQAHREFWTRLSSSFWKVRDLVESAREVSSPIAKCWEEISTTLMSLTDGADLLFTGQSFEQPAANVAEFYNIPLATYQYVPARVNGHLVPFLPAPLVRLGLSMDLWLGWRMSKKVEDAQRQELGLPRSTGPASHRITERGSLEIQAYDAICFPGLAAEWTKWKDQRPFVGALTMELSTDADEEVASWIAAGTPPIFFGFGSIAIGSPADTFEIISAACAQLGERALVCAGWSDFDNLPHSEHVKVVKAVNHAAIFPTCRAVVHHGGAGTTAAGLRAGVPALILWLLADQPYWGAALKQLKVGTVRRFSATTQKSLVADLRTILAPDYVERARHTATQMTKPAESVAAAANFLEEFTRQ